MPYGANIGIVYDGYDGMRPPVLPSAAGYTALGVRFDAIGVSVNDEDRVWFVKRLREAMRPPHEGPETVQ